MAQPQLAPDIEIARNAKLLPIEKVAAKLGVKEDSLYHYGKTMAKIGLDQLPDTKKGAAGKLILVTAISPTPAGEGKTTTTIGLGDALNRIGKKTSICLREPSLGPCFGVKGGATGGGMSQVAPMDDINLHFTGDFHAIGAAHNLLSAMIDNHLHHGNLLNIDPRRITWRRVLDMNDRALRQVIVGLGGAQNSVPRESGFDITVASEVMAIFCLSQSTEELKKRLGEIVIGYTYAKEPVRARDLKAHGAMTVLLKNAINPNLVQTLENNPAFIHGGPFANIAHGCNSIIATKLALSLSDYVVTEAGFGADLGAEKFMDIKCRKAEIRPEAVVLVATIRALKYHGGVEVKDVKTPNAAAVAKGMENLEHHVSIIQQFGVPVVVAINSFVSDTKEEIEQILTRCATLGVKAVFSDHWARGGAGAEDLAHAVVETVEKGDNHFAVLYPDSLSLFEKAETVAKKVYGASGIQADKSIRDKFASFEKAGYGNLPVCMAKTQYSLSSDPKLRCRPKNFMIPIQEVRLSAGAGFVVVLTGGIMTMPGLPKVPAAEALDVNPKNEIVGLF